MKNSYFVYIMTNQYNKVLYIGMTNNLARRLTEHKEDKNPDSFVCRYKIYKLVYYETYNDVRDAISREKQLKGGSRYSKDKLIDINNLIRKDLSGEILW